MRKNIIFSFQIMLLITITIYSETYIRHNQLGYFLNGPISIVIMSPENLLGSKWILSDSLGTIILSGDIQDQTSSDSTFLPMNYNYKLNFPSINKEGTYKFVLNDSNSTQIKILNNPLKKAISENLKFIKVHRAGFSEVSDRKTAHVLDSSCNIMRKKYPRDNKNWYMKSEDETVNLYGGWYDGFSYIKYTLTNAYTTYLLLRAYEENPTLFNSNVELLKEAEWGLEFLCKTFINNNDFIIEVGDFSEDHQGIRLPETDKMDGKRLAYSTLSQPHMGITSAALALGSRIFKENGSNSKAEKYRQVAINIFKKSISLKNGTKGWLEGSYALHKDESVNDNLLLASIEMYLLTKNKLYLTQAKQFSNKAKNKFFCSYSTLHLPAQIRALPHLGKNKSFIERDLNDFYNFAKQKHNVWSIPLQPSHGSNYSFLAIASSFLKYSESSNIYDSLSIGINIYDYMYGKNNWGKSFIVSKNVTNHVNNVRSQIYILQKRKTPLGAVISGPCDAYSHKAESVWCFFDPRSLPEFPFNTPKVKYYDHSDDLMCNESMIYGVAEAIYFQSLLSKKASKKEVL